MDDSILSKTLVTPGDFALYTATRYAMYRGDILVDEALGSGIQDAIERCHAALTAQLTTALSARDTLSGQLAEAREALESVKFRTGNAQFAETGHNADERHLIRNVNTLVTKALEGKPQ